MGTEVGVLGADIEGWRWQISVGNAGGGRGFVCECQSVAVVLRIV